MTKGLHIPIFFMATHEPQDEGGAQKRLVGVVPPPPPAAHFLALRAATAAMLGIFSTDSTGLQ